MFSYIAILTTLYEDVKVKCNGDEVFEENIWTEWGMGRCKGELVL